MTDQQLWALIVFAAIVVILPVSLLPTRPKLDGRPKRLARDLGDSAHASTNPIMAALAVMFGSSAVSNSRDNDSSHDGGFDSGFDGGGDGGGGE